MLLSLLTHLFSMTHSLLPENIRKLQGLLMFQGFKKGCIGNKWVKNTLNSKYRAKLKIKSQRYRNMKDEKLVLPKE